MIRIKNAMIRIFMRTLPLLAALAFVTDPVDAETHDDGVLLKVISTEGNIERFTRERLEGFEQIEFTTETLWTEGAHTYSGPSLQTVLNASNIQEDRVELIGLNGYTIVMDTSKDPIGDDYPIIATRINGEPFEVWEKGPLWIIYNFDDFPGDQEERGNAVSVWQLSSMRELLDDQGVSLNIPSGTE
ncbi:hypothetical protein ACGYLO_11475 [Sulfitobacter sp. 1A13353]|uniref:hypothetical protein n=1 Tax=Sulfitobacter sp. 1A13353 TaxID=3368568 RepID=UPI003745555E